MLKHVTVRVKRPTTATTKMTVSVKSSASLKSTTVSFKACRVQKNTSHGNEVLPQDTTHLIQRPCYQQGSQCQDPAGNPTTRRPDHCKETHTAVVWSCLPFIRSGQNHLARHSERRKKTRQTEEEEVGRQHQGMDRPGVHQVPEGSGEQTKMEETGCKIICGAPVTLAVKG